MEFDEILKEIKLSESKKASVRQLESDLRYRPDDGVKTECFIISMLRAELDAAGLLDAAVLSALGDDIAGRMPLLQQMLTCSGDDYHHLSRNASPYLIYVADETCFGALAAFSRGIGSALEALGYEVIYVEKSDRTSSFYESLSGKTFRGIIATQDTAFTLKTTTGEYLHDMIDAPLYWMDYDHPAWLYGIIDDLPEKTTVLTVDRYYAAYIERYYHRNAVFFPPAAEAPGRLPARRDIRYPVVFIGTLSDNLERDLSIIKEQTPDEYDLALALVDHLIEHPEKTQEEALHEVMSESVSDEVFAQLMHRWAFIGMDVAHHFRKLIVEQLLINGIELHVFHESWHILGKYPTLHIHPSVEYTKTDEIYRSSLIALNTMTWHKAGYTERIANAQINGALSVTDTTEYIEDNYTDGEDIVLYDLSTESITGLPSRIKDLLSDKDRLDEIAYNGMCHAATQHTWNNRAEELVRFTI